MFKKADAALTSGTTLVRNKEAKTIKESAAALFVGGGSLSAAQRHEQIDQLFPGKSMESSKLGAKLVCYADAGDHIPMLIELDPKAGVGRSKLLPTVFALWRSPDLLPTLLVPAHVSRFVLKGADLMWPGVYTPIPRLAKGALVAIRAVGNPAPIAVGTLLCSSDDAAAAGYRGRAVETLHVYRDALWEAAGRHVPNEGFLQAEVRACAEGAEEVGRYPPVPRSSGGGEEAGEGEAAGDEGEGGAGDAAEAGAGGSGKAAAGAEEEVRAAAGAGGAAAATGVEDATAAASGAAEPEASAPADDAAAAAEGAEPAAAAPFWASWTADELFQAALLQGLKKHVKDRDLPLPAARLYGGIMQGCRPAGSTLELRATSWRKVSTFLHDMAERGLVRVGAAASGDTSGEDMAVTAVNRTHELLAAFRPWPTAIEHATVAMAAMTAAGGGAGESGTVATTDGLVAPANSAVAGYRPPLFLTLFAPPAAAYPVFRTVLRPSRRAAAEAAAAGSSVLATAAPAPSAAATAGGSVDGDSSDSDDNDEDAAPLRPPVWSPSTGFKTDAIKGATPGVVELLARAALTGGPQAPAAAGAGKGAAAPAAAAAAAKASAGGAAAAVQSHARELHRRLDMPGRLFTQSEVIEALRAYIAEEGLAHPTDKSKILLDVVTADALTGDPRRDPGHDIDLFKDMHGPSASVGGSVAVGAGAAGAGEGEEDDEEEGDEEGGHAGHHDDDAAMSRVDVAKLWMRRMASYTAIIFPSAGAGASAAAAGATPGAAAAAAYLAGDVQLVKGPLPKVCIAVKALQGGRKHMTYVSGLAPYRIDEIAFAKECSKRCAASASVTSAAEAGIPALAGDARIRGVVQVQGEEEAAITELLTDRAGYGLPASAVQGTDTGEEGGGGKGGGKRGGGRGAGRGGGAKRGGGGGGRK
jgi:predicted RNA-binding protein (TIGR00451 family)